MKPVTSKVMRAMTSNLVVHIEQSGASTLEKVDLLVNQFHSGSISSEEATEKGNQIVEEVSSIASNQLTLVRACLGHLLALKKEDIQFQVIKELTGFLDPLKLSYDVENKQAQELVDLEGRINLAIEFHIRSEGTKNLLLSFFHLYEDVLEHLWLLPYVQDDRSAYAIIVEQNGALISNHANQWMELLEKDMARDRDLAMAFVSIRKALQRIGASLPSKILEEIKQLKPALEHPLISAVLGDLYRNIQDYRRAVHHYQVSLTTVHCLKDRELNNRKWISLEGGICGNLGNAYGSLEEYRKAIKYYEKCLAIALELEDRGGEGGAYSNLGNAYDFLGEYHKAIKYHEKSLAIAQEIGGRAGEGNTYSGLGNAYISLGEYHKAIKYHEKSLAIALKIGDRGEEGSAYNGLGNAYDSLGEYHKAIEFHEKHLSIARELGDRGGEGKAYGNFGNAYLSLGEYRKTIEYHRKNLAVMQEIGDKGGEGNAYGNLGVVYRSLGEYREAIDYHKKSLAIALEIGDRRWEGSAYANLGIAYRSLGEYHQAIEYHEKALAIALELEDRGGEGGVYGNLGIAYRSLGEYRKAIEYFENFLAISLEIGDRGGEGGAYGNLGNAYDSLGEYHKAIEYHEKSLAIFMELGDRGREGSAYGNLGIAYRSLGEYRKALEYHKKDLVIALEVGDRRWEGSAYANLGIAYRSLEEYRKAIEYFEKFLYIALKIGDRHGEGKAYGNLGVAYRSLGEYRKALEYHEKDLIIAIELGDRAGKGNAYGNLGNAYTSLGEYRKAIEYHKKSLAIAQEIGDRRWEGSAYNGLGNAYVSLGEYRKALEYHEKDLAIARELGDRGGEGRAYGNFGNAYQSLGEYVKAIKYHEKHLAIARELGDRGGEGRAYGNLGNAYQSLGEYRKAIEYHNKRLAIALELGDRGGEGISYNNLGVDYEYLQDFQKAEEHLNKAIEVDAALQRELGDNSQWKITFFEEQAKTYTSLENILLVQGKREEALVISDFRRSRALIDLLMKKKSSRSSAPSFHVPLTCEQIQQFALEQNTTFIIYSLASLSQEKQQIGAWIVSPQGDIIWELLSTDTIGQDIKNSDALFQRFPFNRENERTPAIPFLKDMQELHMGNVPEKEHSFRKNALRRFKTHLKNWYECFIAPIEKHLPQDPQQKITIIPDGFLSQMPFAVFRDSEGKYLIEKHALSIAPSIKTLQLLDQNKRSMKFSQIPMIVGNPKTKNPKDALIFSEREAKQVGIILQAQPEQVLIQEKAEVNRVIQGMEKARWIHLACPGRLGLKYDPHSVFEGMLQLSPDEEHPRGHLYAQQIAGLDLNADLVFMSACSSGMGKLQREGNIGHVWSFFASGALSTIATYWPLPDSELTVQIVTEFYQHILGKSTLAQQKGRGLDKAEALREAMLMAIEQERESPDLWGSFFLSGHIYNAKAKDSKEEEKAELLKKNANIMATTVQNRQDITLLSMMEKAQGIHRSLTEQFDEEQANQSAKELQREGMQIIAGEVQDQPFGDIVSPVLIQLRETISLPTIQHRPVLYTLSKVFRIFAELTWYQCCQQQQRKTNDKTVDELTQSVRSVMTILPKRKARKGEKQISTLGLHFDLSCAEQAIKCLRSSDGMGIRYAAQFAQMSVAAMAMKMSFFSKVLREFVKDTTKFMIPSWFPNVWELRWLSTGITTVKDFDETIGSKLETYCKKGSKYAVCLAVIFMSIIKREKSTENAPLRRQAFEHLRALLYLEESDSWLNLLKPSALCKAHSLTIYYLGRLARNSKYEEYRKESLEALQTRLLVVRSPSSREKYKRYKEEVQSKVKSLRTKIRKMDDRQESIENKLAIFEGPGSRGPKEKNTFKKLIEAYKKLDGEIENKKEELKEEKKVFKRHEMREEMMKEEEEFIEWTEIRKMDDRQEPLEDKLATLEGLGSR